MFNPFGGAVNYKAPVELITRTVKTKVMCTVGQTNSSKRDLAKLLIAGMNIARFNASHGTHAVNIIIIIIIGEICECINVGG
jgi:pyruvate kinase